MTSGKKTKFLNASDIEAAIAEVSQLALQQHVTVALIGGAALQLYGSPRLTRDVDIVTAEMLHGIEIVAELSFGGIGGLMPVSKVPIDVVLRDDKWAKLYEAALVYAVHVQGVPIPVVQAEHLLAMKLVIGRAKDIEDLTFLVLDADIDYGTAKEVVEEFLGPYASDELDRFKEEVAWERSREEKKR